MSIKIRSVLVSDAVDPLCVDLLKSHGINVVCKYKLSKDQLIRELQDHDGLIVRSDTKVTKDVINAVPGLRVIGRAGTGVDNIDLDAATRKGIIVINTPGGNSISACEMTCALITSLARNVPQACQSLKEGRWDRKLYTGSELHGKTLAILGLGRIGKEVAVRMRSYGMRTIGFDPVLPADVARSFGIEKMELDEIWPLADYITVHTPLIPATKNLINAKTLGNSKKGVCIINVARGGIVDEEALLDGLKNGVVGGAALDVFAEEPPKNPVTIALIEHPLVLATPHLGASTYEAQQRVAVEIAEQFVALSGRNKANENFTVNGAVNAPVLSATMLDCNVPWISLTQQLGKILGKIITVAPLNAEIHLTIIGSKEFGNMKGFLNVPLLAGILSSDKGKSDLNLINAPAFGKDAGLIVRISHKESDEPAAIQVVLENHSVLGTIGANQSPVLLRIDDASFLPFGVSLGENTNILIKGGKIEMATFVTEVRTAGGEVTSLATASGKAASFAVFQTEDFFESSLLTGLSITL